MYSVHTEFYPEKKQQLQQFKIVFHSVFLCGNRVISFAAIFVVLLVADTFYKTISAQNYMQ